MVQFKTISQLQASAMYIESLEINLDEMCFNRLLKYPFIMHDEVLELFIGYLYAGKEIASMAAQFRTLFVTGLRKETANREYKSRSFNHKRKFYKTLTS